MIDIIVMFVMSGIAEKHVGPDAPFGFAQDPGERARLAGFWRLGLPVFARPSGWDIPYVDRGSNPLVLRA
jgi:hypothetical protein